MTRMKGIARTRGGPRRTSRPMTHGTLGVVCRKWADMNFAIRPHVDNRNGASAETLSALNRALAGHQGGDKKVIAESLMVSFAVIVLEEIA